jgi:hypothetical protein
MVEEARMDQMCTRAPMQNEKNRSVATAGPQTRKKFSNRILATDRI